ncbi:glycosyltransferase involved in cell wall biosynthesis [Lutibacter sp. Hel_I_33_5]|uniref:glycosyltransferase n=1 Tax=Lutibacter sp. Hel_I_33_5 TaxID=1566289 RepID=UPI00119C9AE1|nr:glycosyltransferase [Lutibacter sp. Hel_I_33_5]TVZ56184.1 glycosyltransferase involved in cell wall biosynthesis [Lutibacter sp. Hel_I_33_5]
MKVAIIHYWFITRRGGEKVVESILKLFPDADVYTLFYDKKQYGSFLKNHTIYSSSFDTSFYRKHYQKIFPLYPKAINSLKLKKEYDLIISSESGPAKGIKINNTAKHICYIHSPMRYCWGYTDEYLRTINPILRPLAKYFFNKLKTWDKTTINNVDLYIANSINIANRVEKFYQRKAKVIYPPIEDKLFEKELSLVGKKEYYLSFGAITPYKRIDLLVETFNSNGKKLIVIGNGSEKKKLEKTANKNIKFVGKLEWHEIEGYIIKSRALLFPGEEDFGMIPLEVMSFGVPVIAYRKGGALETVIENRKEIKKSTGIFFDTQSKESLIAEIDFFESVESNFDKNYIKRHAEKFKESKFLINFKNCVEKFIKK